MWNLASDIGDEHVLTLGICKESAGKNIATDKGEISSREAS
jgi:hypothetical protein